MARKSLSGLEKAAILVMTLGPELSSAIMKQLPDTDIERLTYQIANIASVDKETRNYVVDEFLDLAQAQQYLIRGGIKYAREILEKTLGAARANEIIKRLTESSRIRPFSLLRKTDPRQLLSFLNSEHPQTIALILAYLEPEQSAVVLASLPEHVQADIAKRMALMDRTSPEVVREVEGVLEKRLSTLASQDFTAIGGVQTLVDILNRVDRGTERRIIETLEQDDPSLAEEVRKRMFVFEDIITLDDNSIRRVLREVDSKDLSLALKGASDEVVQRVFRNMSQRAADMLREEIDYLGPTRLRDVEEAQQRVVQVIRRLDEAGEIIIARGGEDAIIM